MAYLFHIQIEEISNPPVWRRLLVPEDFSFSRFHRVIQAAFGWDDDHVYEFSPSGWDSSPSIGPQFEKYFGDGAEKDSNKLQLNEVFNKEKQTFTYIYDFGDEWVHRITLEKITGEKLKSASCVDGNGACPPEDCGGALDYSDLLEIIRDPKKPQHNDMMEWVGLQEGETWETANAFDLQAADKAVRNL